LPLIQTGSENSDRHGNKNLTVQAGLVFKIKRDGEELFKFTVLLTNWSTSVTSRDYFYTEY